jgi:hypothetical protein
MNDLESRLRTALQEETADVAAAPRLADDMVSRGSRVRRRRRTAGGVAGLAVLAAVLPVWRAVDTSSGPVPPAVSPTPTVITQQPPTTPATPKQSTASTPDGWPTRPRRAAATSLAQAHVLNLRVAQHDTYDRVVIDFEGTLPGYHIRYVPSLTYDASGAPVPLHGRRFLQVSLTPAVGHDGQGTSLYTGPPLAAYPYPTLLGAAKTGDVGGIVSFGLAVSRQAGFQVSTLTSPTRLVIDLQH